MENNLMYNKEIKERFLEENYTNEDSKRTARYVFYYSYLNELPLQKDLYDFSREEIGKVLANSNPKSLNVAMSRLRIISKYITWAIGGNVNLRKDNINPLSKIEESWVEQFVDKSVKKFISKTELDEMVDWLINYSDKALLMLLFEGVNGRELSEIRNLRMKDIKEDGTATLYDDIKKEYRELKLSEELINILRIADKEYEYINKNGEATRIKTSQLAESQFIFKPTIRRKTANEERMSHISIIGRLSSIGEAFGFDSFTPKMVTHSGLIYMGYLLHKDKEELTDEDFEIIAKRFNISKSKANGYEYYPKKYWSQFINVDNINKLYGTDYIK